MRCFQRKKELSLLKDIGWSPKSEWIYVRGRRRVGKTWLLKEFQEKNSKNCFYFAGSKGARLSVKLKNFAHEWDRFTDQKNLSAYQISSLDWPFIFREVSTYVKKNKKLCILIFDEIQWMAFGGDSFAGDLKTAWVEWQKTNLIKVIVCGSSSKFFREQTGGEYKMLRGLNTRPHLWIKPLTPLQVKNHCFKEWSLTEATLTYMMIGGIPYYLERIDPAKGFVHAINDAFFTLKGHLLDEIDELLNFDFNQAGVHTVKKILASLGQDGSSQATIIAKTGFPASTVRELIEKLLDYEIIFPKNYLRTLKKNRSGEKYFMKDFFMNFYFQILRKSSEAIKLNEQDLIFPLETGLSPKGYYLPNFTGKAFELFLRTLIESKEVFNVPLGQKMLLKDPNLKVMDYADSQVQIDLIVETQLDRLCRLVECKWAPYNLNWVEELIKKKDYYQTSYQKKWFLFLPQKPSFLAVDQAKNKGVIILDLEDCY